MSDKNNDDQINNNKNNNNQINNKDAKQQQSPEKQEQDQEHKNNSLGPDPEETLLTFPCDFVLKVIGVQNDTFKTKVCEIVKKHYPDWDANNNVQERESSKQSFLSLSITVHATSKKELDALYIDLSASEDVRAVY